MIYTGQEKRINELAELIWDYHLLHHKLEQADCIFALGCHDEGVATCAADLFGKGWANLLVISGDVIFDGSASAIEKRITEAEYFRTIAIENGVLSKSCKDAREESGDRVLQLKS